MNIRLPPTVQRRLKDELVRARHREVGGLLMAEHLGDDEYRILEISVQRAGGSAVCFIRHPKKHRAQLNHFFERTGHNYTRFNYLGEWHSHPSFATTPSSRDVRTMQALVSDPGVGANFLVLLIVRLGMKASLDSGVTVFRANEAPSRIELTIEPSEIEAAYPREVTDAVVSAPTAEHDEALERPMGHGVLGRKGE